MSRLVICRTHCFSAKKKFEIQKQPTAVHYTELRNFYFRYDVTEREYEVMQSCSPACKKREMIRNKVKARLNGFNICFNIRSTRLLNQMSGAFEEFVRHC